MSPKTDNQEPSSGPDVTVNIPHGQNQPAPTTAPPLPVPEPQFTQPANVTTNVSTDQPVVTPAPTHDFHEHEGRRWPIILLYLILAFLVAVLVVFAGRWIYRSATHQGPKKVNQPASANQNQTPAPPPTATQSPTSGAANTPSSSTNSSASGSARNQTTGQPAANGQLPNNGPGDVVAIFVGVAAAAGGLHYLYSLRKQGRAGCQNVQWTNERMNE